MAALATNIEQMLKISLSLTKKSVFSLYRLKPVEVSFRKPYWQLMLIRVVGLNLTMAQKVIICDPWWNQSQEDQAFGRVFRIGQKCKTSLVRLITERTIEERMIEMQKDKQSNIDKVMSVSPLP